MRRVAVCVSVALLLVGGVVAPSPVQAHVDACFGNGAMATPAMVYPGLAVPPPAGAVVLTLPTCTTTAGGFVAVGTISGWCGHAWGSATAAGHFFVFVIENSTMVLHGSVTGVLNVVPNVPAGQSCLPPGAVGWIAQGTVALAP